MWGWLTAIVKGLVEPWVAWLSAYWQGRDAQQAADARAAAKQAQQIEDAHAGTAPLDIGSDRWLHQPSSDQAPGANDPKTPGPPR